MNRLKPTINFRGISQFSVGVYNLPYIKIMHRNWFLSTTHLHFKCHARNRVPFLMKWENRDAPISRKLNPKARFFSRFMGFKKNPARTHQLRLVVWTINSMTAKFRKSCGWFQKQPSYRWFSRRHISSSIFQGVQSPNFSPAIHLGNSWKKSFSTLLGGLVRESHPKWWFSKVVSAILGPVKTLTFRPTKIGMTWLLGG